MTTPFGQAVGCAARNGGVAAAQRLWMRFHCLESGRSHMSSPHPSAAPSPCCASLHHPGLPQQTAQWLTLPQQRQLRPAPPGGPSRAAATTSLSPASTRPRRFPGPRVAARPHLRRPQLLGAELRLRPLTLTLVQQPPVRTRTGPRPKLSRHPRPRATPPGRFASGIAMPPTITHTGTCYSPQVPTRRSPRLDLTVTG